MLKHSLGHCARLFGPWLGLLMVRRRIPQRFACYLVMQLAAFASSTARLASKPAFHSAPAVIPYCPASASAAGLHGNAFRIKPPMCWTKNDVNFAVAVLDQALSEL